VEGSRQDQHAGSFRTGLHWQHGHSWFGEDPSQDQAQLLNGAASITGYGQYDSLNCVPTRHLLIVDTVSSIGIITKLKMYAGLTVVCNCILLRSAEDCHTRYFV